MTLRITEKDLSKFQQNSGRIVAAIVAPKKKRSKFGNVKVTRDAIVFDSKLEGRRYEKLKLMKRSKHVLNFWRQPVFDLGGGVVYRGDFLIHWALNDPKERITCEDCKGADTQESINKRKQVKALYGIDVILVRK
jgi:hypothetical protein